MKALSLWQPWASAMFTASDANPAGVVKSIETRHWQTAHRGLLAIHAAKRMEQGQIDFSKEQKAALGCHWHDLPVGCIVGVVWLVEILPAGPYAERLCDQERAFGNYAEGRFLWVCDEPYRFRYPIPFRGAQGLFDWECDDPFTIRGVRLGEMVSA